VNPDPSSITSLSDTSSEERTLIDAGQIEAQTAQTSEKPANFANASPFPNRREEDMVATVVLGAGVLAIVAFLVSMIGLLQVHAPR